MQTVDSKIDEIKRKLEETVLGDRDNFLPSLLNAYNFPTTTIKKLLNAGPDSEGYYSVKRRLLFKKLSENDNVEIEYFHAIEAVKDKQRFVIVTDFNRLMAEDTLSGRGIDIPFDELPDSYEFFLPWCGREIVEEQIENPADVKAASQMASLFVSIKADNAENEELTEEAMNIFLTRVLFCFFADDTKIFKRNQFQNAIILHTNEDGSNMQEFLLDLFEALDTPKDKRYGMKDYYLDFPYVNGGLFKKRLPVPRFSKASRKKLLECGTRDWASINPDIFGSMFQTVISENQRRELGQHYTSVPNIMKVLNPLFLDGLRTELDDIASLSEGRFKSRKILDFRSKLASIKVFDPACGSGNFLITAYKELCHLDMEAIDLSGEFAFLGIKLNNFYGIEIDDFPCEIARLSLWLAEHQINMECFDKFGNANPTLPLTESGHITCGNALTLNWADICPINDGYIYMW